MTDPRRDMQPMHEAQHSFDVVLRGYDRNQVAETIDRLEADFRIALAERDTAQGRAGDLASQLQAMQAEMENLRRKAATAAAPTFENMSERISHMLRLAEEEAAEIRKAAEQDAQAVREQSAAEERAMHERHAAGQAEVERMLAEARQNADQIASKAQIRADELVQKAQERVARLDAESQARRAKAEEDFDIALRARRAEAARQEEERERVSTEAARQRVADAERHSAQLVAEAEAKAAAIRDVRDELTARLHQARQLLSTLPDLSDRPAPTAQPAARPAAAPARAPEGEAAAAHQPVRPEAGPTTTALPLPNRQNVGQTAGQAAGQNANQTAGQSAGSQQGGGASATPPPAQGPATRMQPAVSQPSSTGNQPVAPGR
jgi:cell division septum initiation protein DivIVA